MKVTDSMQNFSNNNLEVKFVILICTENPISYSLDVGLTYHVTSHLEPNVLNAIYSCTKRTGKIVFCSFVGCEKYQKNIVNIKFYA